MNKKNNKIIVKPDTIEDIKKNDLMQLANDLLGSVVRGTDMLSLSANDMSPEKLKEAKLVLGYLNAANSIIKTKMQFFKMTGLDKKLKSIKDSAKKL